ncbi:DUF6909 family protein [Psychroflexus aestuariivivens]|uniref:DUF6909 family protein n=1 Tax=Psychroflexus aestuariivivens TaxID=1795040 RepID=UPI000FD6F30B|nr:hypothetical protein [Psychroflexus aestuariivivens]
MIDQLNLGRNRAQESTNAIERMYITMRHLFIRGFYKPMGVSGETLREALLTLRPEIYGSIAESKVELNGLQYIIERLPEGIEECSYINLTSDEGYSNSHFKPIVPPKRRRNCYRIDDEQMNIEITRGRSEIYDILTHLTFLFIESHKIMQSVVINDSGQTSRDWEKLRSAVTQKGQLSQQDKEIAITHTANILGRTFAEINAVYNRFSTEKNPDKFLHIIYNLGKLAIKETIQGEKRIITFSPVVRERLGHHIHGEIWANKIKQTLFENDLMDRKIHIISANMHSVMNTLYASLSLPKMCEEKSRFQVYEALSSATNQKLRQTVTEKALSKGMISIDDQSGTNIDVQIFDLAKLNHPEEKFKLKTKDAPVIIVMDYAFGEQAYETMDELLKPYKKENKQVYMNVDSISIMGKAGILQGGKGDLMIPDAHLFEGTADNYPFHNELKKDQFEGEGLQVFDGSMVTVLGTSLQNKDLLKFFHDSTWNVIGLEMEGAHYQKAIQAASKLRGNINADVKVRYAYYASDNPLETGSTLASGGLGTTGVKPTYLITEKILEQIFNDARN